ncbi:Lysosomal Pro-X carboxypeptidase [Orchesella cincta]|uniref:Lysosomal Pro-X carboxypeptidase n=1 Tax=Orchesella cincta TaxID=48709 RepID=A0A1D2NGS9_ORCCI|nr:Lysosomal Pro-X carboxypeptidase [Orchesella cincta]
MTFSIFMTFVFVTAGSVVGAQYRFKTDYYDVPLDHFSFTNCNKTFPMKYLYNDTYFDEEAGGPIFFYTGNEGNIEWFAQNTGFMWDIAAEFGALLLFAEHRYYGSSLPFGNDSFSSPDKSGYLTSEQALADFADFLQWFKRTKKGVQDSPVIAFGGSYGGMLTAWMRIKYPHIIQGGIAASAPVLQFQGITPCNVFNQIVTRDFDQASPNCSATVRKSWDALNKFGTSDAGREWLSNTWRLCEPLKSSDDIEALKNWLVEVYGI